MEIKKIEIETLKLKAVEPDVNQRNTRVFKKKTVDLMMKIISMGVHAKLILML